MLQEGELGVGVAWPPFNAGGSALGALLQRSAKLANLGRSASVPNAQPQQHGPSPRFGGHGSSPRLSPPLGLPPSSHVLDTARRPRQSVGFSEPALSDSPRGASPAEQQANRRQRRGRGRRRAASSEDEDGDEDWQPGQMEEDVQPGSSGGRRGGGFVRFSDDARSDPAMDMTSAQRKSWHAEVRAAAAAADAAAAAGDRPKVWGCCAVCDSHCQQ